MVKKHSVTIGEYTAKSLEWEGKFDLTIYKGEEEVFSNPTYLYSLNDCSKIIRKELGFKGKKITWVEESKK